MPVNWPQVNFLSLLIVELILTGLVVIKLMGYILV